MASAIDDVREEQTLSVAALADRSASVLERLRSHAQTARAGERREPSFPIGKAADLAGRTTEAIREAEQGKGTCRARVRPQDGISRARGTRTTKKHHPAQLT